MCDNFTQRTTIININIIGYVNVIRIELFLFQCVCFDGPNASNALTRINGISITVPRLYTRNQYSMNIHAFGGRCGAAERHSVDSA